MKRRMPRIQIDSPLHRQLAGFTTRLMLRHSITQHDMDQAMGVAPGVFGHCIYKGRSITGWKKIHDALMKLIRERKRQAGQQQEAA